MGIFRLALAALVGVVMAWSDSLFDSATPDPSKAALLARVCNAVYSDSVASVDGIDPGTAVMIQNSPTVKAWTYKINGERHVTVEGTTQGVQYEQQAIGYLAPLPWFTAGECNSFGRLQAGILRPLIPGDTRLLVGHSLGGVVASITGRMMVADGLTNVRTLTFGAPRFVTPPALSDPFWPVTRNIVGVIDVVPMVPNDGFGGRVWRNPGTFYTLGSSANFIQTLQSPSTALGIASTLGAYGDLPHRLSTYNSALLTVYSANLDDEAAMPQFRIKVDAAMHGQRIQNVIHYNITGAVSGQGSTLLAKFRDKWREKICAAISNQYAVILYSLDQIAGVAAKNLVEDPVTPVWRYTNSATLAGLSADEGHGFSNNEFATFTALGVRKTCQGWLQADGSPTTLQKKPKGGIRIAGMTENFTDAGDGNRLNDGAIAFWQANMNSMLGWTIGGFEWSMIVVRNRIGLSPIEPTPGSLSYQWAIVETVSVNPYLTTQNTRKQTLNRLG